MAEQEKRHSGVNYEGLRSWEDFSFLNRIVFHMDQAEGAAKHGTGDVSLHGLFEVWSSSKKDDDRAARLAGRYPDLRRVHTGRYPGTATDTGFWWVKDAEAQERLTRILVARKQEVEMQLKGLTAGLLQLHMWKGLRENAGSEVSPQNGGCWFCARTDNWEDMRFDGEFDTNVHLGCVRDELQENNPEAEFMQYLLKADGDEHPPMPIGGYPFPS